MTKKRWVALLSVLGIVVAAALTTAAVMNGGDQHSADDSPLLVPSTTATTVPRTTTTHAEPDDHRPRQAPASDTAARRPVRGDADRPGRQHRDPEDRAGAPGVRRHHPHGDRPRSRPLARIRAAVPAGQQRVPRAPGHPHAPVPQPRPVVAGRSDHLPHAGTRLRVPRDGHADRAADRSVRDRPHAAPDRHA